jgi:hypothetical protein
VLPEREAPELNPWDRAPVGGTVTRPFPTITATCVAAKSELHDRTSAFLKQRDWLTCLNEVRNSTSSASDHFH